MTTPNQQTYPVVNPSPTNGVNLWSTGLFNCFDDADGCVEGTFCGPCQRSRQYNMIVNGSNDIHYPSLGVPLFIDFCIGFPVAQFVFALHIRHELRRRYQLEGNDFRDLVATACCMPFSTCQNYREMSARGEWAGGCCSNEPPLNHDSMGEVADGQVLELKTKTL